MRTIHEKVSVYQVFMHAAQYGQYEELLINMEKQSARSLTGL